MIEELIIEATILISLLILIMIILLYTILSVLYQILEMVKPAPQTGIIKGNVIYGDASLIGGVLMTLSQDGTTVASVLTGIAGEFEFDPMAMGTYVLVGHKDLPDGWLEFAPEEFEIDTPELLLADLPLVRRVYGMDNKFHLRQDK